MSKTELSGLKWVFELLVVCLATIMSYHTSMVASFIFENSKSIHPVGIAYAIGVEFSMIVAAYSLTKSPNWLYSAATTFSLIVSVVTSAYAQLMYANLHSPVIGSYWNQALQPAMDFAPIYMSVSLAVIILALILPQLVLTKEAQTEFKVVNGQVVTLRNERERREYEAKNLIYQYPTKTGIKEFTSEQDYLKAALSYFQSKHGAKYIKNNLQVIQEWLRSPSGQLFSTKNTLFNHLIKPLHNDTFTVINRQN